MRPRLGGVCSFPGGAPLPGGGGRRLLYPSPRAFPPSPPPPSPFSSLSSSARPGPASRLPPPAWLRPRARPRTARGEELAAGARAGRAPQGAVPAAAAVSGSPSRRPAPRPALPPPRARARASAVVRAAALPLTWFWREKEKRWMRSAAAIL